MQSSALSFVRDESGAITTDFVVMGAGVVAGVIAVLSVVSDGTGGLSDDVSTMLAEVDVGTAPGSLPWAGPQSGTAAAEAGAGGGVNGGSGSGGDGIATGLGTGAGSTTGSGETGADGETTDLSELEELIASLDPEVLVVDPAAVIDEVVTELIQDAVDGASAAIQILAQREVWAARVGDAAFPQAADVVAAFDAALISQGMTPPV